MSRNRRKDDFHGSTGLARRNVVGAASQIYRESNHGETEKGGPLWGLKAVMLVWPNHGVFEALSRGFGNESWYFQITAFSEFRGRKQRPLLDRHTHTRRSYDLENPKD